MLIQATRPLFAWDCLEDSPTLTTVRRLLAAIPNGKLLASLRQARGKGRDDYPVSVLWGSPALPFRPLASAIIEPSRRHSIALP